MTTLQLWDEPRKRVTSIQNELNNRLTAIRSSDTLSPAGRRIELARATQHAQRQIDALRKEHTAARDARRQQLETHLFGISTTTSVADTRDAYDRANRLDTQPI